MVALSFGALSLSSSPQVKNSCPFWAGSSVNLFVLLSVVCVLLNLAGFILGCQGAQFVSSVPRCDLVDLGEGKICFCCEEFQPAKCTDKENALKLFPVQPCSAVHLLLKKVLFALCALNALTTTVCLVAAALRYLQIFATRRSCIDESQISAEEVEDHGRIPDPDDFVPPAPPPSYFATFYSCTPRMNRRMVGPDVIPLPHIYGARIKGVEVFCPLDPPPPYEAVVSQMDQEQGSSFQMPEGSEAAASLLEPVCTQVTQGGDIHNTPVEESTSMSTPSSNQALPARSRRAPQPLRTRSKSDPVLHHSEERAAPVLSCEAATQTERRLDLAAVTLRRGLRPRASRCRPRSLIDYKSYIDTKLLVARFLEQSSCRMTPDIHELVENIKSVLKSDEEHMEEAITSASFLEQIMAPLQPGTSRAHVLPSRRQPGLLHLRSCGDLSIFAPAGRPRAGRRPRRAEAERPHSLIGVIRETVL
ncbi:endosomal transmembrane epsin interactor 1 isoform X2 [Cynocephalus volans]|uniref:endosomal transmembrane epsin interactor 1 isoform X2 n=1 Tax=Cynocephalus volans TaxID=110931 RepID=UPI002FC5EF37